jgi:hypothetical protein
MLPSQFLAMGLEGKVAHCFCSYGFK